MKKITQVLLAAILVGVSPILLESCKKDDVDPSYSPPQADNQMSYFPFSGNMNDVAGNHTPVDADVKNLTFTEDRFGVAGQAGDFNGSTTLVEIPKGEDYMASNSFTISVWIKASSARNGHFVLGLAGWKGFYYEISSDWSGIKIGTQYALSGTTSDSEDLLFSGIGETKDNGGWQGNTFHKDVLPHGGGVGSTYLKDKWVHVICTYESLTRLSTMYLNGEKMIQTDFNLWPAGNVKRNTTGIKFAGNLSDGGNKLALGFIQGSSNRVITAEWANPADLYSNHFQGQMDDLRIFKVALTEAEVTDLYTAEK